MCPACLATISMIVAGMVSTGGATALAWKTFGRRKENEESSGAVVAAESELENEKEKQR